MDSTVALTPEQGIRRSIARASVLVRTQAFIQRHATNADQSSLLERALLNLDSGAAHDDWPAFIHLPLLVYAAIRGDSSPAIPLAAATTLVFLGIDILDDLADGDLPIHWNDIPRNQVTLAAATLLSAMPQLAIAELEAPPATLAVMQHRLAAGLLRMSEGQQHDLSLAGSASPTSSEVECSVVGKSGEELAMFAALAAEFAGADADRLDAYERMGRALGIAGQLASDCNDLFEAEHSRDLASGTRTLPIALHLERVRGQERQHFLDLLDRAQTNPEAQCEIRSHLREAGELRRCAFVVELYCQRGLRALDEAQPWQPAATDLRAMIQEASFFGTFARNDR